MILCARIPYFAAAVEPRDGVPLVVLRAKGRRRTVIACSADAQRLGIAPGMSQTRARALCLTADFRTAAPDRYDTARDRLLKTLWTFSHRVEIGAAFPHEAVCYLDMGELRESDAQTLASGLADALRTAFKAKVEVGGARGKLPAFVAALASDGRAPVLIPHGDETAFIARSPVALLPLDKEQARRLAILGIRTLGDLAALPRPSVIAQLGKPGAALHLLASGRDGRPVQPEYLSTQESVRLTFEPTDSREHIDMALHQLAIQLGRALETRAAALHHLRLTVQFERGKAASEDLRLFQSVSTPHAIAETLTRLAARVRWDRAVIGLEVSAGQLVSAAPTQLELFGGRPARGEVIDMVAALKGRYGAGMFYTVVENEPESPFIERRYRFEQVEIEALLPSTPEQAVS